MSFLLQQHWLFKIILTTVIYVVSCIIGLEFTQSFTNASFLWPAAGVALACIFMFGPIVVIGITLGALLNKVLFLGDIQLISLLSSVAPALQAYVSYRILKPLFNDSFTLVKDKHILQFFFFTPLFSLISPTLSLVAIYYSQGISDSNLLSTWFIWWFGDTFGVLIFTPLFFALFSHQNEWIERRISVGLSLLVLTFISIFMMQFAINHDQEQLSQRLLQTNSAFNSEIDNILKQYEKNLQAINIFFLSTYHATPNEVKRFLTKLNFKKDDTTYGYGWFGFADLINRKTDTQYAFFPLKAYQFALTDLPIRVIQDQYEECTIGSYLEIHENLDTTHTLYRNIEASISSIDNLCASEHLGGIAYVDIDIRALIKKIIKKLNLEHVSVQLIGTQNNQTTLLFEQRSYDYSNSELIGYTPNAESLITYKNTFWKLKLQGHEQYIKQNIGWNTWSLFIVSLLFTAASGFGLLTLTARKLHTESIVDEKSNQLQEINNKLSNQIQQQKQQQILIIMQSRILEMIAKDEPLKLTLNQLCLYTENQVFESASVSITTYNQSNKELNLSASPNMPKDTEQYFTNLKFNDSSNPSVNALKTEQQKIIKKIDPSLSVQLDDTQAYWATPIISHQQKILGVLTITLKKSRSPNDQEQQVMSAVAALACISFERHNDNKQLNKLSNAVESSPNGIVITSKKGIIEYANPYFCQYIGQDEELIKGEYLTKFVQDANDKNTQEFDWDYSLSLGESQREYMGIRPNGEIYWCKQSIASMYNKHENSQHVLSIHQDITAEYTAHQFNKQPASHDSLTGLYNRVELEYQLQKIITHPNPDFKHALAFLNLNDFKTINNECGHATGDSLIKSMSQLIEKQLRRTDFLARISGDQFAIIFEQCPITKAKSIMNSLLRAISNYDFIPDTKSYKISASVGLVEINEQDISYDEILSNANTACYLAKKEGHSHVYLYHDDDQEKQVDFIKYNWPEILNNALINDDFILYAQAIVKEDSDVIEKYEILLRLKGDDNQIMIPNSFLNDAEHLNLMPKIDRWVISKTFEWAKKNPQNPAQICINISGQTLDITLMLWLQQIFKESKIAPEKICFEIKESIILNDFKHAKKLIESIASLGCSVSIDGFNSGISSFSQMRDLAIDYIKIDGQIVKSIEYNLINRAMVKSLNEMIHIIGKKSIVQHIENEHIDALLKTIDLDFYQGYNIGKPNELDSI